MSSYPEESNVVYVAVPMNDDKTVTPSAPAIFVPSTSRQRNTSSAASRPFVKAALVLCLGFAVTTLLWVMMPMPCHHTMLRGAPLTRHGMGHHDHPGNHVMMHDMMHPHHEHGMGHRQHSGDHAMMHSMMNPHKEGNRRWKDMGSSSSSQDGMDGWYAGNKSHDGWHASLMNSESYDSSESADSNDNHDSSNDNSVSTDQKTHVDAVERVEMEKEDGMIPGVP